MMKQKLKNPLVEKYMKVKEERGKKDEMRNGELTDRYETLDYVKQDTIIKNNYIISELDEKKGGRLSIVDKNTGETIWEMK